MLSAAFSEMESSVFYRLPDSTNAVESYNRLCKGPTPDVLSVAMMTTYRLDMAAALQHLAVTSGISVTYERHLRQEVVEPVHRVELVLSED